MYTLKASDYQPYFATFGGFFILPMWTSSPTAGSAFPFFKFPASSFYMKFSCLWSLNRFNPAYPFIACEWSNILPGQKRRLISYKNFS